MKVEKIEMLIEHGEFSKSKELQEIRAEILLAIEAVDWHHTGKFVINPLRRGNGVNLIKKNFIMTLKQNLWDTEKSMALVKGVGPGPIDATKKTKFGLFAVEWETGNISSSHRALNKISTGVLQKQIIGGILVLPMRQLSAYLTDRIGNYEELVPYFPFFRALHVTEGVIGIIAVTYDDINTSAPLIPKGKDGNAKKRKKRKKKAVKAVKQILESAEELDKISPGEILNEVVTKISPKI